jgi:fructokinase
MLLNGEDPQYAINFASAVGAIVAQNEGANPVILQSEIEDFLCGFEHTNSDVKKSNIFQTIN